MDAGDVSGLRGLGDVTTEEVAQELKDVLLKYKISQRLFGQAVLNVHKNVISLLLLEPKTWSTLSRQASHRYMQIYIWLQDPKRFQKISDFLEQQSKLPKCLQKMDPDESVDVYNFPTH
jgi:hypothetical protein